MATSPQRGKRRARTLPVIETDDLMTIAEAMVKLRYSSRQTIYALDRSGQLELVKIGEGRQGRVGVTVRSISRFLAARLPQSA